MPNFYNAIKKLAESEAGKKVVNKTIGYVSNLFTKGTSKEVKQLERFIKLDNKLQNLSKLRISDIDQSTKEGVKLVNKIRTARKALSNASKAQNTWIKNNTDKATKVYKSGAMEFLSNDAKASIAAARMQAFKDSGFGINKNEQFIKGLKNLKENGLDKVKNSWKSNKKYPVIISTIGVPTLLYAYNHGTGWTNTLIDLIGNNIRKKDGTPLFTVNRDFDDMSSNAQAFLQDAVDKKEIPGYWKTPEEREAYFQKHPNDTIKANWYGRLNSKLKSKGITQSDYKKYYGINYGTLSSMPGLTGFGINLVPNKNSKTGYGRLDPITAGLYETQQSMGSFPLAYVKDGVLTDGEGWDFRKEDKHTPYTTSLLQNLRVFAGRHGTNEADEVPAIVTSNMKIPYKKRDKK